MRVDLLVAVMIGVVVGFVGAHVVGFILVAGFKRDDPADRIEATRNRDLMRRRIRLIKSKSRSA